MKFEAQHIYHVFNQGNNQQQVFSNHEDYKAFLSLFKSYCIPYCDVLAWCLLPNHFHFMLVANDNCNELKKQGNLMLDPLTNGFRKLSSAYSHSFNQRNERTGSLFRPKTKVKDLSEQNIAEQYTLSDYYINCFYYIHQNPYLHGLVADIYQWKYSSFLFYADKRPKDFCNKQLAVEICDYHQATFVKTVLNRIPDDVMRIF